VEAQATRSVLLKNRKLVTKRGGTQLAGSNPDEAVEVVEKNDQMALRRIVAGREIPRNDE
jgi:hypothetical protein